MTFQGSCQGIYQPSSTVNGRPSWTSSSAAIWYDQKYKNWKIASLNKIGTSSAGIRSEQVDELVGPQNVVSWQYISGLKWNSTDDKNDIIVERINCE